jgi:hypothetical protein
MHFLASIHHLIRLNLVTVEAIEAFLHAKPFRPFRLITASGERCTVLHPDFLHFSPRRRTCNVYAADGEFFSTLDVLTITDVQPNGHAKRARRR